MNISPFFTHSVGRSLFDAIYSAYYVIVQLHYGTFHYAIGIYFSHSIASCQVFLFIPAFSAISIHCCLQIPIFSYLYDILNLWGTFMPHILHCLLAAHCVFGNSSAFSSHRRLSILFDRSMPIVPLQNSFQ